MSEITYAKVHGPPRDWHRLEVIDLDTDMPVARVVEVDAAAGWIRRHAVDAAGRPIRDPADRSQLLIERVEGRFAVRRRASPVA